MADVDGDEKASGSTPTVFVSYASQDAAVANSVVEALEQHDIGCWIAPRDVTPGASYAGEIIHAIDAAKASVLILSHDAASSPHVLREVERAASKRHPIISLRIDQAPLPADFEYFLNTSHWLDTSAGDMGRALPKLVAAVQLAIQAPAVTPVGAHTANARAPVVSGRSPKRTAIVVASVVGLGLVAIAADRLWLSRHRVAATPAPTSATSALATTPAVPTSPDKSLAVLPFVNLSGNKDSYLGDGISGEILSALSRLPGLRVIGRASSFQFRDRDVDAVKVGKALNVRSLLTGTVQRAGDKLRISVELIDTTSGVQLWSQHFDRSFRNLFALEDDISNAVSTTLAVKLGMAAGRPLVQAATANPQAHDLYMRARELFDRSDEPSQNQAVNLFNQAIAADPNYAAAWAGLAYSYIALADAYRAPIDVLPVMKAAAKKAVTLDSTLAEGHAYLSYILGSYVRDFAAGERESEKSVALSPGSADVQFFLGNLRIYTRRAASAQSAFQMAERLDPLNPFIPFYEVLAAVALGDSATAVQKARRTLEIDPAFFYLTDPLVLAYGSFSRWQDCIARFAKVQALAGREPDYKAAVCYAHVGNNPRARGILAQLEADAQKRYVDHAIIAEIYVALGEKDAAFKALEQAYNDRSQPLALVSSNPEFRSLHNDVRYRALMEKLFAGLEPGAAP
jgi:TolB-like protein/tetratricopeptide (TPR) repeat protein